MLETKRCRPRVSAWSSASGSDGRAADWRLGHIRNPAATPRIYLSENQIVFFSVYWSNASRPLSRPPKPDSL